MCFVIFVYMWCSAAYSCVRARVKKCHTGISVPSGVCMSVCVVYTCIVHSCATTGTQTPHYTLHAHVCNCQLEIRSDNVRGEGFSPQSTPQRHNGASHPQHSIERQEIQEGELSLVPSETKSQKLSASSPFPSSTFNRGKEDHLSLPAHRLRLSLPPRRAEEIAPDQMSRAELDGQGTGGGTNVLRKRSYQSRRFSEPSLCHLNEVSRYTLTCSCNMLGSATVLTTSGVCICVFSASMYVCIM